MHQDKVSGSLLLALGIFTIGTGLYFVFVRPSLLPEEVVFTGIDPNVLPPQFLKWLGIVFATWGGFTTGFGLTLSGLGAALFSGVTAGCAGERRSAFLSRSDDSSQATS